MRGKRRNPHDEAVRDPPCTGIGLARLAEVPVDKMHLPLERVAPGTLRPSSTPAKPGSVN
jgi:hypothetical protein